MWFSTIGTQMPVSGDFTVETMSMLSQLTILAVTCDSDVVDDLCRLASASQSRVDSASSASQAIAQWKKADIVVVGDDLADQVVGARLPKRSKVWVVARSNYDSELWRQAMLIGADQVLVFPADESNFVELLNEQILGSESNGVVVSVMGGSGGAGASVLTAAIAGAAQFLGASSAVVDLDQGGAGLDYVLGANSSSSEVRWGEIAGVKGRIPPASLVSGLPLVGGLPVLTWGEDEPVEPPVGAVAAAIESLRASHELVVIDLGRTQSNVHPVALAHSDLVSFVCLDDPLSAMAANRALRAISKLHSAVDVLVRAPASRQSFHTSSAKSLGRLFGVEPMAEIPYCRELSLEIEMGARPGSSKRSKLGRFATQYISTFNDIGSTNHGVDDAH